MIARYPMHVLAAALCGGLAAANAVRVERAGIAAAVVAAAAVAATTMPVVRLALLAVVLACVGWWWGSARLDALDRSAMLAEVGRAARALVEITAPPRRGGFEIRAQGRLRAFAGAPVRERIQLELPLGRSPPQGALVEVLAVVELPRGPSNGFDERTWLRRHGVHVILRGSEWRRVGRRGGLGAVADRLRERLTRSIAPRLTGERRAVLQGIVLGDDEALADDTRDDFRAAGLYHLLAVSGQNVVLVAGGVLLVAWLAGIQRWAGEIGALAAIGAYVLAVGPQPSVVRAGVAGAVASLAWLTARVQDAWYVLLLGAIVLLAWNPYLVFDAGFQLSFAAVSAIFTLARPIAVRLEGYPMPQPVRDGIGISAACGLVTAPILWLNFRTVPLLAIPANILVEPVIPALLGLAFATAAFAALSPSAAAVVAAVNGWIAAWVALVAHAIGSLPFAQVSGDRALLALTGATAASAYAWRRWRRRSSRRT